MENYYKGIKNMHWRKDGFFNKWWWENQTATYEKKKKKERRKETRLLSHTIHKN